MSEFPPAGLLEAQRAIASLLSKCEKSALKLPAGGPQHSLMQGRIRALVTAAALIEKEMRGIPPQQPMP